MERVKNIIVLILLRSILRVQPLSVGHCFDKLMESHNTGVDKCSAAKDQMECIFHQTVDLAADITDSDIIDLENLFEKRLANRGVHCDIDFRAILKKVMEDRKNAVTHATRKPTGYGGAETVGDCLNAYISKYDIHNDNPSCSTILPFFKCAIKVTELYKLHGDAFSSQEGEIKHKISIPGLDCKFNMRQLAAEVAREQNASPGDSAALTTTATAPATSSVTVAVAAAASVVVTTAAATVLVSMHVSTGWSPYML
ncbi:hypothetical protein BsWGS_09431 [Bradybaena similaris]